MKSRFDVFMKKMKGKQIGLLVKLKLDFWSNILP